MDQYFPQLPRKGQPREPYTQTFAKMSSKKFKFLSQLIFIPGYPQFLVEWLCTSQIKASTSPLAYPGHLTLFSSTVGREFDELSLPRGGAFDHNSSRVGNLIVSLDFVLRVALFPRKLIEATGKLCTSQIEA